MTEPIKLPLKITDDNRAGGIYLGTDDNKHMIIVLPQLPGREPAKAIAEYIVLTSNSHKDLLDSLALFVRLLTHRGMFIEARDIEKAEAVIEKSGRM